MIDLKIRGMGGRARQTNTTLNLRNCHTTTILKTAPVRSELFILLLKFTTEQRWEEERSI